MRVDSRQQVILVVATTFARDHILIGDEADPSDKKEGQHQNAEAARCHRRGHRAQVGGAGHCLALTEVRNDLLPVLEVWVTGKRESFDVDGDTLSASCWGFSGNENLRFWDKVLRQFARDYEDSGLHEVAHVGNFHDEAKSPSRVTLDFCVNGHVSRDGRNKERVGAWMREVCRELFQVNGDSNTGMGHKTPLSADYQCVLRQLQPFMDEQRFARELIAVKLTLQA